MRFFLAPFGSTGDLLPFVWIGRLLQDAGHEVRIIAPLFHQERLATSGLPHDLLGEEGDIEQGLQDPDLWHPVKGPFRVFRLSAAAAPLYLEALEALRPDESTVLLGPCFQPATRIVRERYRCGLWTVHLQPSALLSLYDTP